MPARLLIALAAIAVLSGCTDSKPDCQKDPPFYLKGTKVDCATHAPADTGSAGS